MNEKKTQIDDVEIQPLSDEDLEGAAGGLMADSNSCPSDGCPTTFTCSCGCSSDAT